VATIGARNGAGPHQRGTGTVAVLTSNLHLLDADYRAARVPDGGRGGWEKELMQVQVVQDLICPWCRIGKRNLDVAIERRQEQGEEQVDVEWVPFLLDPVEPGSKEPFQERLRDRKGMNQEQIAQMFERATEAGKAVGLTFNFDRIEVAVDTIPGHQLIALAPETHQSQILDALHTAYFEEGKDIGDTTVLESLAESVGLPEEARETLRAAWASDELRLEMVRMVQQVQEAGISGVPFFIIDSKLGVNGAQPAEVLQDAMEQAKQVPAAD
jgi:predicted DsbA family dithiol-disulfide isomerase